MFCLLTEKIGKFLKRWKDNPYYLDMYLFCHLSSYNYREYQYYHFKDKLLKRFSFISFKECEKILPLYNKSFLSKKDSYLLFSEFYGRDCFLFDKDYYDEEALDLFLNKHTQFIIKELDGSSGIGIKRYDRKQINKELLSKYSNGCLIEEIIKQTEDINRINSSSINSLRITTINYGDKVTAIYPIMRFGVNGSLVDNSPNESIFCAIENGEIISAIDEKGNSYNCHPNTGVPIIGFEVPELDSAINQSIKLANHLKDNVFVGFDYAHTKDGWILIEANTKTNFTIWQLPYQKGFRKELKMLNRKLLRGK